jgi:hypothetical protein
MESKLRQIVGNIGCGVVGLAVAAGVVGGCYKTITDIREGPVVADPTKIDYDHWRMQVRDYSFEDRASESYTWDIDDDGKIDAIGFFGTADWIAPGYEDRIPRRDPTRTMTPEMIEYASKMEKDQKTFSKMMLQETIRQMKSDK